MDEESIARTLKPDLWRALRRVFFQGLIVTVICCFLERFLKGHWWSGDYWVSLTLPLVLFPVVVCLMFVPRSIRWSAEEFEIERRFRSVKRLRWSQLHAFGELGDLWLLQFSGAGTFQIMGGAFRREEWQEMVAYLKASHPEKKAWLWVGPHGIRRRRKLG